MNPTSIPRPGVGLRLHSTPFGYSYSARRSGGFGHPFRCALASNRVTVGLGLLDGREPTIGGVPITGAEQEPIPFLRLDPADRSEANPRHSWVCVSVSPKEDGTSDEKRPVEIIHASRPTRSGSVTATHPLALVVWREEMPLSIFQMEYFNLRYQRSTPSDGGGASKDFFF